MRNAQHYRGIDVTDGVRDGNLRQIRRCRFENSQHSRGFDVPARGRAGDLRHIRRRSLRNRRHSRGFDVPGREKGDAIEESQSRAPVLPRFLGPLGGQVVRFAGGARFLLRRTAKSRHIREPGCPVCLRHAVSGAPDRKNPAQSWSGGVGGGRRQATGARTKQKHLRNRHLSLVLEVEIVAVPPPARGRRPAALRPAVEPACRTQPGRSGLQVCRAFAVRCQGIGVAHATRAPRVPDRPRFCGPAAKIRRAARNLGDPGLGSAVFLRSGGEESVCRT